MRKTSPHLYFFVGLLATATFSLAQTVSTPIVGFSKVTIPNGSRAVVPGFVKPAAYSSSGTVSGQSVAATSLTANAFQPTQFSGGTPNFPTHYLEIVSGPYEGYSFDVVSNTVTSVVVDGLPVALNGTTIQYVVRPHLKIGDIDSSTLPEGNLVLSVFNNPSSPVTTYLYDAGGNWYDGSGSYLMNHAVIYPGTGISLANATSAFDINFTGQVKVTKTVVPVYRLASVNLVGPMNPSTQSVLNSWAAPLPEGTIANVLSTTGNNDVSLTLLTDTGSTILYDGGGNELPSVSVAGQNAFGMSSMSSDGFVTFASPVSP